MQKSLLLVASLFLFTAIGSTQTSGKVTVNSPVSGSTVTSPVHFVASAQAPANRHITAMGIYVDYKSVYFVQAAKLDTYVTMTQGSHKVTVQAWDNSGTVYKRSLSVTVKAGSVTVSISPTAATLQTGQSKQFTATVSGTTNTSINWYVAGIPGGSSTVGTITSSGLYTAPACASSSSVQTVTAQSVYDSNSKANASVSIAATTPCSTSDRYVSPTGSDSNDGSAANPWRSIQHAATLAKAGMTIHVAPGTYTTSATISSSASGTPSARIRYLSDQKWGAKIVTSATQAWAQTGSYVDVEGFDISSSNTSTIIGIHGGGNYDRYISNHIHNMPAPAGTCPSGGGIMIGNSATQGAEMYGNVIHDVGIAVGDPPGQCNQLHGFYVSTPNCKVMNNLAFRSQGKGIQLWGNPSGCVVMNNTTFWNQDGIVVGGSGATADNLFVANNIAYKNVRYGIYETGSNGTNNRYSNNLVYSNPGGNYGSLAGNPPLNTVSADPQFVNYTGTITGDYHLRSTSPAINRGTSVDAPSNDLANGPRPQGTAWDIGAYEYNAIPGPWPMF